MTLLKIIALIIIISLIAINSNLSVRNSLDIPFKINENEFVLRCLYKIIVYIYVISFVIHDYYRMSISITT